MATTKLPSFNLKLGPAKKIEKKNALTIKKQASPPKANKFMGMSDAKIKSLYSGMSAAEKKANGIAMAKASQANKAKKNKPAASKPAASKPTSPTKQADPQRNTGSGRDGKFGLGTSGQGRPSDPPRPNQTLNGASLGSKLSPAEKKRREKAAASVGKGHKGGSRASNNTRNKPRTPSGPKVGSTRRIRKGSKYVTQMWDGKKYVTGKLGTKGAKG